VLIWPDGLQQPVDMVKQKNENSDKMLQERIKRKKKKIIRKESRVKFFFKLSRKAVERKYAKLNRIGMMRMMES
jgi:hypothetical protein